jgi:lipoprotein
MKKLLSLGFLSLSVVVLVACSQGKNSSSETSSTSEVKQETAESSKSTEASSKTDDKLPRVSADQMASFIDYFKQDLTDKGVDISTYTFYNKDTILYVKVPNEYKYYPKTDLHAFADGLKTKEHEAFNVWAATNEVDFNSYPMLHIKTDDGDSLVSQKLNGDMEVKVK